MAHLTNDQVRMKTIARGMNRMRAKIPNNMLSQMGTPKYFR